MSRLIVSRTATWPTLRSMPVRALLGVNVGILLYTLLQRSAGSPANAMVRDASVMIAMAVAFGMADSSASMTGPTPTPLWTRRVWRVAASAGWGLLTWLLVVAVSGAPRSGLGSLAGWLAGLGSVSMIVAVVAARRDERTAGIAGSAVVAVSVVAAALPGIQWPISDGMQPDLLGRDLARMGSVVAVGVVVGLRDPGRRRLTRRWTGGLRQLAAASRSNSR